MVGAGKCRWYRWHPDLWYLSFEVTSKTYCNLRTFNVTPTLTHIILPVGTQGFFSQTVLSFCWHILNKALHLSVRVSLRRRPTVRGELSVSFSLLILKFYTFRLQLKCDGTRWRMGGEVKGKLANGVGSQYPSHYLGTWYIQHYYRWCAHLGCQ